MSDRAGTPLGGWIASGRDLASSVWQGFREDDIPGTAAELSFRWLLALFPLAIMTAALAGFAAAAMAVEAPTDELLDALGTAVPPDAATAA